MNRIARRTLLSAAGLAGIGVLGYGGSLAACAGRNERQAFLEPLFPALRDLPDPMRAGRAWLAEEDGDHLVARLLETRSLVDVALQPDPKDAQEMLRGAIRSEFARGDVVLADRWVLTRMEARIAAGWVLYG